jgi:hypothetical protein
VNLDEAKDKQKAIDKFKAWGATWRHIHTGEGWNTKLAETYGVHGIPACFLIDREGKVVSTDAQGKELERQLQELLGDDY